MASSRSVGPAGGTQSHGNGAAGPEIGTLIGNDSAVRDHARQVLEPEGFRVDDTDLDLLAEDENGTLPTHARLVVVDLSSLGEHSRDLVLRLRHALPDRDINIFVITDGDEAVHEARLVEAGADDFI